MDGPTLEEFATELNGGASIGSTLLFQYFNLAKALVEQLRPWMILRKRYTGITVTATSTSAWQTGISLAAITDFSRFNTSGSKASIRLFDGNQTFVDYYQVPFEDQLQYINSPNTFCYDAATKTLYLNGIIPFAGTLYINYIANSTDITNTDGSLWSFPSWSHALLGYYAVAMNKGGVDYDDINRLMAPENQARAAEIVKALTAWDNSMQLTSIENTDPTAGPHDGFRPNAINMH